MTHKFIIVSIVCTNTNNLGDMTCRLRHLLQANNMVDGDIFDDPGKIILCLWLKYSNVHNEFVLG